MENKKLTWKERIEKLLHFIKTKQIGVMLSLMMMFLCFVMISWGVAFWLNGIYDMHFDLGSCWQGITVVATGLVTVAGFAAMPFVKYWLDSKYNSDTGEAPTPSKNEHLPSATNAPSAIIQPIMKKVLPK